MAYDNKFGPAAQTQQQRASILRQMLAVASEARVKLPLHVQALHQRYVAGELSWNEVCALREAPSALPPPVAFGIDIA